MENLNIIAYKRDKNGDYDLIYKDNVKGFHYLANVTSNLGFGDILALAKTLQLAPHIDIKTYVAVLDNEVEFIKPS